MRKIFTLCAAALCAISMMAEDEVLYGKFTVNASGDQVLFSQGNLQYQASTNTWRFAENQWDTIGAGNQAISDTNEGWIDLFGWATSGWDGGTAINYQPWATFNTPTTAYDQDLNYYGYGPDWTHITGTNANYDWGVYNAISNGGNQAGLWRTLTKDEWKYIINERPNASSLRSWGAVEITSGIFKKHIYGYFLLSDDVDTVFLKQYLSIDAMKWRGDSTNIVSQQAIECLQNINRTEHGRLNGSLIFLPCAGYRDGVETAEVNSMGFYWSANSDELNELAYAFSFGRTTKNTDDDYCLFARFMGSSVRLVKDYDPSATAIGNTAADVKAVKRVVNGQLFIEKNGKTYNALGAEVK